MSWIDRLRNPARNCREVAETEAISYQFPGTNEGGGSGKGLGYLVFDQAGDFDCCLVQHVQGARLA
jgi:hypothetical protein